MTSLVKCATTFLTCYDSKLVMLLIFKIWLLDNSTVYYQLN